LAQAVHEAPW
jgi:hypothetical protein